MNRRRMLAIALAGGAAGLSGCVIAPLGTRYEPPLPDDGPGVGYAPPPPQAEVIGVAPALGMVWLGGYWAWAGGRYTWQAGHWAHPRPGYHWVPHAWVNTRRGWVHRPGHWKRR